MMSFDLLVFIVLPHHSHTPFALLLVSSALLRLRVGRVSTTLDTYTDVRFARV